MRILSIPGDVKSLNLIYDKPIKVVIRDYYGKLQVAKVTGIILAAQSITCVRDIGAISYNYLGTYCNIADNEGVLSIDVDRIDATFDDSLPKMEMTGPF